MLSRLVVGAASYFCLEFRSFGMAADGAGEVVLGGGSGFGMLSPRICGVG